MAQQNVLFAFLFVAFVLFVTARGKLRTYMGFIL